MKDEKGVSLKMVHNDMRKILYKVVLVGWLLTIIIPNLTHGIEANEPNSSPPVLNIESKDENLVKKIPQSNELERNYYEVLSEILSDFEYDLKNNNVSGIKNISIKNIATSENIPSSFKSHLEFLLIERIIKSSKSRVIQCLPCKSRKTTLDGNEVKVISSETNPAELTRIAQSLKIESFMDVSFAYQQNGMLLSLSISDVESGSIIWSKSYNSETTRASAFRKGVDYSQLDQVKKETEYTPTIQYRMLVYYLYEPAVGKSVGALTLGYRMMERYDNRKKEVGFEANYMANASTIVSQASATKYDYYKAYKFNLTMIFLHAWNFIGEEENYNKVRHSISLGLGGTYASGYLGGLLRSSYEMRLGKHFGVSGVLGYRPASTAYIGATKAGEVSGLEYGVGVNFIF